MRKKMTTTLDEKILQALKIQAVKENTNMNRIIEKLVSEYLKDK